jgi:hypothetical protein
MVKTAKRLFAWILSILVAATIVAFVAGLSFRVGVGPVAVSGNGAWLAGAFCGLDHFALVRSCFLYHWQRHLGAIGASQETRNSWALPIHAKSNVRGCPWFRCRLEPYCRFPAHGRIHRHACSRLPSSRHPIGRTNAGPAIWRRVEELLCDSESMAAQAAIKIGFAPHWLGSPYGNSHKAPLSGRSASAERVALQWSGKFNERRAQTPSGR